MLEHTAGEHPAPGIAGALTTGLGGLDARGAEIQTEDIPALLKATAM